MRLVAFDHFRGIAILFIVAGHSFGTWTFDSFGERLLENLVAGGSTLFVFISGFFFHYIFYKKFNYAAFLVHKGRKIFLPYFILTVLGFLYFLFSSDSFPYFHQLMDHKISEWFHHIELGLAYLWTGRIAIAYWYIPFAFLLFVLSPLFVLYIRLPATYRVVIFLLLLGVSMFVHRSVANLDPIHQFIYFLPIYLLGINCSVNREQVVNFIMGKHFYFGAMVIILALLQTVFYEGSGNFVKEEIFSYAGVDILIIQKIFLCFFFLSILQKYEDANIPGLKFLATVSFAIYFIHPWLMFVMNKYKFYFYFDRLPEAIAWLITLFAFLLVSLMIAYLAKAILKSKSKYLIGW